MKLAIHTLFGALALFGLNETGWAQGPGGGKPEMKELIKKIEKEMELIDKLLNQATESASSKRSQASDVSKFLESSVKQSHSVVEKIDKLLEQAEQNKSNKQQQQQQQQNRDRQQQERDRQNRQRRPDNRMDNSPDLVERDGQRPNQRQNQRQDQPKGPKEDRAKGVQQRGKNRNDPPGKRFNQDPEAGRWGDLPKYLQLLFKKAGQPKVPSKYKRFREEFHKRADQNSKKR